MSRKNRACLAGIAAAAVLFFLFSSRTRDGAPKTRSNVLPDGEYACEAGTLTFWHDSFTAPSSERGYADVELEPEYIYLLNGRENNTRYGFRLDERHGDYDTWYIYADPEIPFLNFTWEKRGWDTRRDTVIIQGADGSLVFRFNEIK